MKNKIKKGDVYDIVNATLSLNSEREVAYQIISLCFSGLGIELSEKMDGDGDEIRNGINSAILVELSRLIKSFAEGTTPKERLSFEIEKILKKHGVELYVDDADSVAVTGSAVESVARYISVDFNDGCSVTVSEIWNAVNDTYEYLPGPVITESGETMDNPASDIDREYIRKAINWVKENDIN